MTVQVSTAGPGVEDWRSSKFAVTVNGGAAAYVYGFAREAQFSCIAWDSGETVEQSWFGFGADETATVAITLADATPITSSSAAGQISAIICSLIPHSRSGKKAKPPISSRRNTSACSSGF